MKQVISEYFKEHSIGDIGGDGLAYTPLPGFPGTLTPGTQFIGEFIIIININKCIILL